jgi:hypothetical protein
MKSSGFSLNKNDGLARLEKALEANSYTYELNKSEGKTIAIDIPVKTDDGLCFEIFAVSAENIKVIGLFVTVLSVSSSKLSVLTPIVKNGVLIATKYPFGRLTLQDRDNRFDLVIDMALPFAALNTEMVKLVVQSLSGVYSELVSKFKELIPLDQQKDFDLNWKNQ